jgi:hypothetical protein
LYEKAYNKLPIVVKKNPRVGARGKGGYYEKLMEVNFRL